MIATVTLQTTTFATAVAASDTQVTLTSLTNLTPGMALFAGRELLKIVRFTGIGNGAVVLRGRDGTETRAHSVLETVYAGSPEQFFETDPQGVTGVPQVNPHINVKNGTVWVTVGDDTGPGSGARIWQQVTVTEQQAALGVRAVVTTTPS